MRIMSNFSCLAGVSALLIASQTAEATLHADWQSLGGYIVGTPSAFDQGGSVAQVYVRGGDNAVWARVFLGTYWRDWESLGGSPAADALPVAGNRAVYMRWSDNRIYKRDYLSGSRTWGPWTMLSNSPQAAKDPVPFVMYNSQYVAFIGVDRRIYTNYPSGSSWSSMSGFNIGTSQLAVAADSYYDPGVDIFLRADNSIIYRATHNSSSGWQYWWAETGGFMGKPAAIRYGNNRTYVFSRMQSNSSLGYFTLNRYRQRSALQNLGGVLQTDPTAHETTGNEMSRLDVFARDFSGIIQITAAVNGVFSPWANLNAPPTGLAGQQAVTCDEYTRLCDVFGLDYSNALWVAKSRPNL